MDPLKGVKLQQPVEGYLERLTIRVNRSATKIIGGTLNNLVVVGPGGDIADGGPLSSFNVSTKDYIGERYITDAQLPEAGTEEGTRHGSYRIGLLTEGDFAYFDENGKLIFYGAAGVQIIVPVNLTTAATMFAVLDPTGNLKYRTAAQLVSDLSTYGASKDWTSETFITEAEVHEAEEFPINFQSYLTATSSLEFALAETQTIICDSSTAFTVNLPHAYGSEKQFVIKSVNTGVITVDGYGSETIDDVTTQTLHRSDCMVIHDYADGKWCIV
jgi:hypothetical protein